MVTRDIENIIFNQIQPGKVIRLYGARRVGKTVLSEVLTQKLNVRTEVFNGEDFNTTRILGERSLSNYKQLFSDTDLIVIDEAQYIKDIGLILKLIVDNLKNIAILITGSSAYNLFKETGEPLVGRSYSFKLYPFSIHEISQFRSKTTILKYLDDFLIYGSYPEVVFLENYQEKQNYLLDIVNSYLLKDILMIDGIKNSAKMRNLLRLIAFQSGSEVSYDEIGKQLALSRNTVEKYLDLLSQTYIIYRLPAFSKNPRKEISKSGKWYFYDNGIRNALIGDFRPLSKRDDTGILWENFIIAERMKYHNNKRHHVNFYFWRSYSDQEIDLIEEYDGNITATEIKFSKKSVKCPSSFKKLYPTADFKFINRYNLFEFIENSSTH